MARSLPDELELMSDAKYRSFASNVDRALKGFEYTSEWADLVNALGKLNKVLQNNAKYPIIPRRFIVGQRLAQCLHPALPSGVHLKALETYDLVFTRIGTDNLVQELSIYSNGLFPLLSHAAINVKPALLEIYKVHFVPLGERLKPALDGFLIAVLPGLEDGSDYHGTTENLLKEICEGTTKEFFYGSLWRCILYNPSVRLPAVSFVTSQFNKKKSLEDQLYIMGTSLETLVNGICSALLDPNVLVQRAILDLLLCCFPMHNSQMVREDMINITTAAVTVLLRRDISLNRRLLSWFFGLETTNVATGSRDKSKSSSSSSSLANAAGQNRGKRKRDVYFDTYSKQFLLEAFIACLTDPSRTISTPAGWNSLGEFWPYRLLICLLDNQEIKAPLIDSLGVEIFRALYHECKQDKVKAEMRRTTNLLVNNLGIAYSWKSLIELFDEACKRQALAGNEHTEDDASAPVQPVGTENVTVSEMCAILDFMIDLTAIENYPETSAYHLPKAFTEVVRSMTAHMTALSIKQLKSIVELATKMVSKMQPPNEPPPSDFKTPTDSKMLLGIKEENENTAESEKFSLAPSERSFSSRPQTTEPDSISSADLSSIQYSIQTEASNEGAVPDVKVLVENVQTLYTTFVNTRLLANPAKMQECYESLFLKRIAINEPQKLQVNANVVSVYSNLCQLLLRTALLQKQPLGNDENDLAADVPMAEEEYDLPIWLRYILALSCLADDGTLCVNYCSLSTYLALLSIQKALALDLSILPSVLISQTPSSSPVMDFSSAAASSTINSMRELIEPLLTSKHVAFIANETLFYTAVIQLLWENLADTRSEHHLETSLLMQQIHDLADDASICESVICASMASSDETVSYEARKRFCTLYNITREIKSKSSPFNRREFDRPLFFMLDSLTHKLDSHNTQAVDWLIQCLKNGDGVARILEPLLFILLHPDTSRVSVQHVNIHPDNGGNTTGKSDEADNAAQAAAEARIYAISNISGNVVYHVNPEGGKKQFASSPVPPKSFAITTSRTGKGGGLGWITSRFNMADYEIPPSHEPNILAGRFLTMSVVANPFGSQSSLVSDALDQCDQTPYSTITASQPEIYSGLRKLELRRPVKSHEDVRKTPTPSPAFAATPTSLGHLPSRFSKISVDSESLSDSEVVKDLVEELIDTVVEKMDDDDSSSGSSSASGAQQTISESISVGSWVKPVSVNQLHSHLLLYTQVYDSRRTLYALTTLWNIILTDPQQVLFSLTTTSISNRIGFRSQELQSLCARHRKSLFGKGFYSELDTESITAFRSSSFLEIIVTTCLYYIRSYYPGLPQNRLSEDEVLGNQKVRILSCEIMRLIFSELVITIKRSPMLSCYIHDMLLRCKVQKVVLHSVVSSVYNFQFKSDSSSGNSSKENSTTLTSGTGPASGSATTPTTGGPANESDVFSESIVEFNEKLSAHSGFQEDMQKSLLKLLEQLMVLEYRASPNSTSGEKEQPTHNRKQSESRASRIRFQPQMSSLKYCPNVQIPSQAMFLSAIQTALQQSYKAHLHSNWLSLVEATLPFAGRSLTRIIVCVISQLCHNLESYGERIVKSDKSEAFPMPPNYLLTLLKSAATLCHYCLLDPNNVSTPPLSPQPHPTTTTPSQSSGANPLQVISNFFHVWGNVESMSEQNASQANASTNPGDPIVSARRTVLSHLPRILNALLVVWKSVSSAEANANTLIPGWEVMGNAKEVKQRILDFLSPLSIIHGTNFLGAVAVVWYDLREVKDTKKVCKQKRTVIPVCSHDQNHLVDLIAAIRVLPMDIILKTVQHVMKHPPQTTHARKKRIPLEVCMLQFFLAYIRVFPGSQLLECWKSLLALLKEGLQVSAAQPLAQFHLLAILHEFVQAAPLIEDRKDQKDLQDVAQKLVDACTTVAGARLGQSRWLRRNLEVKPGPQQDSVLDYDTDGEFHDFHDAPLLKFDSSQHNEQSDENDNSYLSKYSVQALNALAEFVAPVLDVVYISEEKEKVVPLVSNIMYYVTPYLRNHSKHNVPSFRACSHLLSSISGYQYSRKAWRKDAFELLLEPNFFQMDSTCFSHWETIVDHLMTHDKTTFRDFISRMSVTQTGSLKIFSSKEQENEQRAQLAKRLAFILFCSEKDQYQRYMPEIQEKLIECLKINNSPEVKSQIMLCFRVLILRMSHHHLTSLWPYIYTEIFQTFLQIQQDVSDGGDFRRSHSGSQLQKFVSLGIDWGNGVSNQSNPASLQLYLQACKLLDLAIALPCESLPQFQMYRWAFVGEPCQVTTPSSEDKSLLNHLNNNHSNHAANTTDKSPSRSSSQSSSGTNARATPTAGPLPFEPHVTRIERELRAKNSLPTLLPSQEGRPLLTLTSIKSITDLHPFFFTLMRICQSSSPSNQATGGMPNGDDHLFVSPQLSPCSTGTNSVPIDNGATTTSYIDSVVELDFIEEPASD